MDVSIFNILFFLYLFDVTQTAQPNIVFILADDLGWNDVSFHGYNQIPTPNIDKLANTGVILNNYYVQPICTPSRSALMTGKYPIHTGMQSGVILAPAPYGLGLDQTLLPEYLKKLGYATHGVGKWHLGFYQLAYTPVHRGFDSYYGYWTGKEDYWNHTNLAFGKWGLDLHDGDKAVWTEFNHYSTYLYTDKATDVIKSHNSSRPLFLYLSHQAVHSANTYEPLQAPNELIDKFKHIENERRRVFAAMVTALDQSVGKVVDALKDKDMYKNTIVIFSTDNGGAVNGFNMNYASNYPLRGVKSTLWEGGIRGTAFVHSPLIKNSGRVSTKLLHICDWLPTLYVRAGGESNDLNDIDGYDVWKTIANDEDSPRKEILHNIDPETGAAAYRKGKWKLIVNETLISSGWYPPLGHQPTNPKTLHNAVVECTKPPPMNSQCTKGNGPCLFDINADPCEYKNLADKEPKVLKKMLSSLEGYRKHMVPTRNKEFDENADPAGHGWVWTAWM